MSRVSRSNRAARRAAWWTALSLVAALARVSSASPVDREAAIVARALAFERSLDERIGNRAIGIAVVFKPQDAASERCSRDWREGFGELSNVKIQGHGVALSVLPYSPEAIARARANAIDVFVVCSGLAQEAQDITRVSRTHRILTVGTLLPYVEQSMTLGVFQEQEGKYRMVVNVRVAAAEGVTFSSSMLKLARVVR